MRAVQVEVSYVTGPRRTAGLAALGGPGTPYTWC